MYVYILNTNVHVHVHNNMYIFSHNLYLSDTYKQVLVCDFLSSGHCSNHPAEGGRVGGSGFHLQPVYGGVPVKGSDLPPPQLLLQG